MKRIHLLGVTTGAGTYATLVSAAAAAGLRVGWLELSAAAAPPSLAAAAEVGVLRAVAVGEGGSVVVKPRAGEPVLTDLLREHFLGCSVVLVVGDTNVPQVRPAAEGWEIETPTGSWRQLDAGGFVKELRKPRPFFVRP